MKWHSTSLIYKNAWLNLEQEIIPRILPPQLPSSGPWLPKDLACQTFFHHPLDPSSYWRRQHTEVEIQASWPLTHRWPYRPTCEHLKCTRFALNLWKGYLKQTENFKILEPEPVNKSRHRKRPVTGKKAQLMNRFYSSVNLGKRVFFMRIFC